MPSFSPILASLSTSSFFRLDVSPCSPLVPYPTLRFNLDDLLTDDDPGCIILCSKAILNACVKYQYIIVWCIPNKWPPVA